jgi:hypothetical protein
MLVRHATIITMDRIFSFMVIKTAAESSGFAPCSERNESYPYKVRGFFKKINPV